MTHSLIIRKPMVNKATMERVTPLLKRLNAMEYRNRKRAEGMDCHAEPVDFPAIVIAYNGCCCICQQEIDLTLPGTDPEGVTLEHIISLGQGGKHTADNIGQAHRRCNLEKSHRLDTPKAAKIRRLRGETGQRARRERNGSKLKSAGFRGHRKMDGTVVWKEK